MKAFNLAYYWKHIQRVSRGIVHPDAFFYPLDALDDWNLIYGRRGFTQYQCVLPHADDNGPARRFLESFVSGGGRGFLCVIKDCGAEGKGMISFPKPGISIALDFPIHPAKTPALVDRLNELVIAEGGRIYLTKDAFTRPEHFARWSRDWRRSMPCGASGTQTPHPQCPIGSTSGRPRMKAVLFGASKGMGRALARELAARGDRLFLLGDMVDELEISARDLEIRGAAAPVKTAHCDLLRPDSFAPHSIKPAGSWMASIRSWSRPACSPAGTLENDPQLAARLLTADFTNTVLFCEEARKRLLACTSGHTTDAGEETLRWGRHSCLPG